MRLTGIAGVFADLLIGLIVWPSIVMRYYKAKFLVHNKKYVDLTRIRLMSASLSSVQLKSPPPAPPKEGSPWLLPLGEVGREQTLKNYPIDF
ncbi:hypothetical protein [Sinomicrobium weinanense]|uniref:Uncharacterized protein n=1 Tax=Sinomicrobium weinanense TaxID=2842200 RepID=A0A926Q3V6_9FLAO|nr:hypothetical protein [Sinomicrobium weinanense]MBC9797977.1 hypothetical protein [Sinomicrobium weinanense]MBU3125506.1 hypothetical protein [Sinomicrobium weinanense]